MNDWVRFESIEIKREGYYVRYDPMVIGFEKSTPFVSVRIIDDIPVSRCKEIAELEYQYWFKKFPIPLQVNIRYEKPRDNYSEQITGCSYICGETLTEYRWGGFNQDELNKEMPLETRIKRIYEGLECFTSSEGRVKSKQERLARKLLKFWAVVSLVVFPAIVAFLGWSTPVFAAISLMYAWYKCADKLLLINGQKLKTAKEIEKEKKQQLMEHYYYHCSKNPEAFEALKLENFQINQANKRNSKLNEMKSFPLEQN
ncbi:hypothetical protein ATN88_18255 [Enterovibrio coralii]|uniref:Uncharacterized protein n=2 Tax=Enterovibrio coralii TaxID=294935 RepID=A0A135I6B6_9GAMM|nr:hypothetical protein ATN88_18255 [Enterovibrio coralii]